MEKDNKRKLELSEVAEKNKNVDQKIIQNINQLREQARNFGHVQQSSYRLTPPLGNQLLFARK